MDAILDNMAAFTARLDDDLLPAQTRHAARRALVDSVGCALGGADEPATRIARRIAGGVEVGSGAGATTFIDAHRTTPDLAAFSNGVAMRALDYNDVFHSPTGGGHPSDYIAAVLAAGEAVGADGRRLLTGIVAAYELVCRHLEASGLGTDPWDQVVPGALGAAGGAAVMMRLPPEVAAHALSLAVVPSFALRQTRYDDVSMWKGCAAAGASRHGVFAAMLAAEGLTAPARPFEGRAGAFVRAIEPFEPPALGSDGAFAITRCQLKRYPIGSLAQTAVTAADELRSAVSDPSSIARIDVTTHAFAIRTMAGDPEKWAPANRETADHSLPFAIALTLARGTPRVADFASEAFLDPALVDLMGRIHVETDEECERAYPDSTMVKLSVTMADGTVLQRTERHHRGHPENPMSDQEVEAKFLEQAEPRLGETGARSLLDMLWNVDEVDDLSRLSRATVGQVDDVASR